LEEVGTLPSVSLLPCDSLRMSQDFIGLCGQYSQTDMRFMMKAEEQILEMFVIIHFENVTSLLL
jgi:hypothetical protein